MRDATRVTLALLLGAGLTWWALSTSGSAARGGAGPPQTVAASSADGPAEASPPEAQGAAANSERSATEFDADTPGIHPEPRSEVSDLHGKLELPDGTFVPTLNGVESAPALGRSWRPSIPWSPIERIETAPDGVQWYVHADGTRSTTVMAWHSQQAQWVAVTRVGHPTDAPTGPGPGPAAPSPTRR